MNDLDSPPAACCGGCVKAAAEIRTLLDYISASFRADPSRFLGFQLPQSEPVDCPELFRRWARKFDSDPKFPWCSHLRKRIEALVYRLLTERAGAASQERDPGRKQCRKRKFDEGLMEMLASLKDVAVRPWDEALVSREWELKVRGARTAMFLRLDDDAYAMEFPYLKRRKTRRFLSAPEDGQVSSLTLNNSIRRSRRTVLKIGDGEVFRKRIPIGSSFQVDVPEWTDPKTKKDISDDYDKLNHSRWLGTQLWPLDGRKRQNKSELIVKQKANTCRCTSKGSVECVRLHVSMARLHLKSELGPAFFSLGFADMGEEASRSWTQEEQMKFDELVRQNPPSVGKSFWEPALEYFTSKRRQDVVNFYFNVFLLRLMGTRTRLGDQIVDSSDDESLGW